MHSATKVDAGGHGARGASQNCDMRVLQGPPIHCPACRPASGTWRVGSSASCQRSTQTDAPEGPSPLTPLARPPHGGHCRPSARQPPAAGACDAPTSLYPPPSDLLSPLTCSPFDELRGLGGSGWHRRRLAGHGREAVSLGGSRSTLAHRGRGRSDEAGAAGTRSKYIIRVIPWSSNKVEVGAFSAPLPREACRALLWAMRSPPP